jgi:hypothetical protein
VNLYHNDFDQSAGGTFIQIPFPIDSSNLDNLDPLFVDPANEDYHLQGTSPVINMGDNDAPAIPETDKDGNPRIVGGVVDMGAYEFAEGVPVADAGGPYAGLVGETICFDGSGSYDTDGEIVTWEWDFGDPSQPEPEYGESVCHEYSAAQLYPVSLTVTDDDGYFNTDTTTADIRTALDPVLDIKANGSDGPLEVPTDVSTDITVALDPGDMEGQVRDWWISGLTTSGTYWLDPCLNWVSSDRPVSLGQIALFDLEETALPDLPSPVGDACTNKGDRPDKLVLEAPVPVGLYAFFFAVDNNADGILDVSFYDLVNVIVPLGSVSAQTIDRDAW